MDDDRKAFEAAFLEAWPEHDKRKLALKLNGGYAWEPAPESYAIWQAAIAYERDRAAKEASASRNTQVTFRAQEATARHLAVEIRGGPQ